MMAYKNTADRFYFKDWCMPDPDSEHLSEALYAAHHHEFGELTRAQISLLATTVEAYQHLAGHPADDDDIVAQLRTLRRAVRQERNKRRREARAHPKPDPPVWSPKAEP
jgi:hypothetical protein